MQIGFIHINYLGNLGKGFEAPPHGRSVAPAVILMRSNSPNRQRAPGPLITDFPITHSVGGRENRTASGLQINVAGL